MGAETDTAAMNLEARQVERRQVSLRALGIRGDGTTADIRLLDLSYDGCGIESPVALRAGEPIKLSVLARGAIDAHVRWYEGGRAGLAFDREKPAPKKHWPRSSMRSVLSADVSLKRLGRNSYRVQVRDLSTDGCKVDLVDRPRIGEHMLVKFDGLEVLDAKVCWIEDYVAGLRFERPVHPAVFDLLLQRLA